MKATPTTKTIKTKILAIAILTATAIEAVYLFTIPAPAPKVLTVREEREFLQRQEKVRKQEKICKAFQEAMLAKGEISPYSEEERDRRCKTFAENAVAR